VQRQAGHAHLNPLSSDTQLKIRNTPRDFYPPNVNDFVEKQTMSDILMIMT
jgi:hypothetical protein